MTITETLKTKRVLITGHTGFTGSWASMWLKHIGITVEGYALKPHTEPNLYHILNLDDRLNSTISDINDYKRFLQKVKNFCPDVILHLAAQPLVRKGYEDPLGTFYTNFQGTVNVLEAARLCDTVKVVLCITTDKVYENLELGHSFEENSRLGGKDPYSCSKAAAEMAIQAYSNQYWQNRNSPLAIAVARGGNIIGGGDWSNDRLIPDLVRSIIRKKPLILRYPNAVRPWQHVLDLIEGYLLLIAGLLNQPKKFQGSWNFGPINEKAMSVKKIIELFGKYWEKPEIIYCHNPLPESNTLKLNSSKAQHKLGWKTFLNTEEAIYQTALWYKTFTESPRKAAQLTLDQIEMYINKRKL
jgi:CDP-glucose 4,6-dehydratase